jgi:hypothetical protein
MRRIALLSMVMGALISARSQTVRYLRWNEVQPVIAGFTAPGEIALQLTDARQWDGWVRQRDAEIRRNADQAIEDSISMLILLGTSFTNLPKLGLNSEAVNAAGDLTPAARTRVTAFIQALDQIDSEPFRYILQFLRRRMVTQDELPAYLSGNLRRAVLEQARDQRTNRNGLSLADSAIEERLRRLKSDGKAPRAVRRIGVISPAPDLGIEPGANGQFGILEAVLRLGLAKPDNLEVVVLDVNPWVLSQVRAAGAKNTNGRGRIRVQDLDVVAQTIDTPADQGFDLVVAMNGLAYGKTVDQALAMMNVTRMMTSGGVLLVKGPASLRIPTELELVNTAPGEGIATYRRR